MSKLLVLTAIFALLLPGCCLSEKVIENNEVRNGRQLQTTVATTQESWRGSPIQLTTGYAKAGEAYFAKDMKWVVFQAAPTGQEQYQMFVARTRWKGRDIVGLETPVQITSGPSRNTCGWFTPDGKSLIFSSTYGKDDPNEVTPGYQRQGSRYQWAYPKGMEIFVLKDFQKAMKSKKSAPALAAKPLTSNNSYDAEASMTPDGKQIVYTSNETGDLELWVMDVNGSNKHQLTTTKGYDGGPFVSPSGTHLVYRSDRVGNDLLQVYVSRLIKNGAGQITGLTDEQQLTDDANVNWGPYWDTRNIHVDLPAGAKAKIPEENKYIFFASSRVAHTNYEIFAVPRTGGEPIRITYAAGADVLPVVSPDGRYLMWSSKRTIDNTTQIFLAKLAPPRNALLTAVVSPSAPAPR